MPENQSLCAELKALLSKFNRGVKSVDVNADGAIEVTVTTRNSAISVTMDLLRSRGFSSVKASVAASRTAYLVTAIPKAAP